MPAALAWISAGIGALTTLASVAGKIPSPDTKLRGQLDKAVFAPPRQRLTAPNRPRKEKIVRNVRVIDGQKVTSERLLNAFEGEYPLPTPPLWSARP